MLFSSFLVSQEPRRALKRRAVDQDLPHRSFPGKEQCSDVPAGHMKQCAVIVNNQELSASQVKRSKISGTDSENVSQLQKESSIVSPAHPNRASYCTPATVPKISRSPPRDLDPSSQTDKRTTSVYETLLKNGEKQEASSSIITPPQMDSLPITSPICALSSPKGQEIARLSEKKVTKRLSKNDWNYENRQFSPETPNVINTNPAADSFTDTVAMNQQCITYPVHSYNEVLNPHCNQKNPAESLDPNLTQNPNANLYSSWVSYGTATSVTSQDTPEYAMSHQYPMYQHPVYPSVIAVNNIVAPDYLTPVQERAMNYEVASTSVSTNGTHLMSTNSTQTSHIVHQSQQVYQPIQVFLDPKTLHPYYAAYASNQALYPNQMESENVAFRPALEHGVYPLASWPQVSPILTS